MFSNLFKLQTTPLVGIDISSSTIKLLELSKNKDEYCLENYVIEPLSLQSVVEKDIKHVEEVAKSIQLAVLESKTKRKFAAVAVTGSSVITRVIQANINFTEEEILEQIELEADRYIPYPLDEVYYDFEVLGPSKKHASLLDVLLAAARIETVESHVEAVHQAGLKATIVDIEAFAMERAFNLILNQLPKDAINQNTAIIDLGTTMTTLHVFKEARSIYSRDQVFGTKQLIDEIERRYGLSQSEAFASLKYGGLPEDYIKEVFEPFKETVVQQINRAMQIFFSSSEETEIQYLLLSGGGASLSGLEALIHSKTGIKTLLANPFANMEISKNVNQTQLLEDAPRLLVSLGLALRTFDREQH